jgi:SAM-dependent methyltransferase
MTSERALWEWIEGDAAGHRRTDCLYAALDLRVFDVIRNHSLTLDEAAAALGTAPRRTKALLDLLVAYGYLDRDDDSYLQRPDLLPLTDPQRVDNLQQRFAYPAHTRGSWSLISEALREDRSVRTFDGLIDRHQEIVDACHVSLGARGYLFMSALAPRLLLPASARILDVGGGYGDLCRPFLERDNGANAVLFEAPDTVELAEAHVRDLGLGGRVEVQGGDFVTDPLPSGFDLVILSAVLQFYDLRTNRESLQRLARCLNPGGGILVREILVEADASGPVVGLEFALHMALNSHQGQAYPVETMESLLLAAGCSKVELLVDQGLYYVLLGSIGS